MSDNKLHPSMKRRVFAIISHPDAGKTTLTENMLLSAGAIHQAGQVAARGNRRRTRSDWMKIEQERGISVSSSIMTFKHQGLIFNLLDTPGHEDFSEDTYRTLTAADCAVMVLDAAKGIEPQTLKLFEVCRLRDIPIVTFINKLDREAMDIFEILAEICDKLALDVVPMQWPCASGQRFRGLADMRENMFIPYSLKNESAAPVKLDNHSLEEAVENADLRNEFLDEIELAREYGTFSEKSFLEGHVTPVYFGSALRKFGVRQLLDGLAEFAPAPQSEKVDKAGQPAEMAPTDKEVSGFVFKVQANMDPNHRDRVAFLRLSSGRFKRGMKLKTAEGKNHFRTQPNYVFLLRTGNWLMKPLQVMSSAYPIMGYYVLVTACQKAGKSAMREYPILRQKFYAGPAFPIRLRPSICEKLWKVWQRKGLHNCSTLKWAQT